MLRRTQLAVESDNSPALWEHGTALHIDFVTPYVHSREADGLLLSLLRTFLKSSVLPHAVTPLINTRMRASGRDAVIMVGGGGDVK